MDGIALSALIYKGRGKAAAHIGLPCNIFRPLTATAPLTNLIATLPAAFNSGDTTYLRANEFNDPIWYADYDGTQTQPGDYLVRVMDGKIWFVSAQQQILPTMVVDCNRVVNVLRPQQQTGVGAQGYGGDTVGLETPLITGFPASILVGPKSDKSIVNLPGDVRNPSWAVLLPSLPGNIYLRNEDVITDDQSRRYVISSAELSDLGWRIMAVQAET